MERSRLARALWIEMDIAIKYQAIEQTSRLARALWIEIPTGRCVLGTNGRSRLARALWIEILYAYVINIKREVEARESLVD